MLEAITTFALGICVGAVLMLFQFQSWENKIKSKLEYIIQTELQFAVNTINKHNSELSNNTNNEFALKSQKNYKSLRDHITRKTSKQKCGWSSCCLSS